MFEKLAVNLLTETSLKVSGAVGGTLFENGAGDTALLADHSLQWLKLSGYTEAVEVFGTPGFTELAMHTGCACKTAVVAFTGVGVCAAVLFTDGTLTDGVFTRFKDGAFSLA